jgi:hypothetical protein
VLDIGITGYVLSVVVADFAVTLFIIVAGKLYKDIHPAAVDLKVIKKLLRYSIPMIPATIFWWITSVSDRYMVTYFAGEAENGLYSAAYKIPTILTLVSTVFMEAWQYSAVSDTDASGKSVSGESVDFFSKVFSHYQSILYLAASGVIAFSQVFIAILCADSYFEAWRFIPVLAIASVFSGFASFAGGYAFAVAFMFFCNLARVVALSLGCFEPLADAGRVVVARRGDGPWSGPAGFGDGQTEHLWVDEAHLAVEQVAYGGEQGLGREEAGVTQLYGECEADMFGIHAHSRHFSQGDAFLGLFLWSAESGSALQKQAVSHFAAEFFHEIPHLGAGIEAVVLFFDEPEFFFAGVVEHKIHLLAAVAEVLGVVGVEGGAFKAAHIVARFKVEAVHAFHAAGASLEHNQISSLSCGMRLR